MAALPDTPCCHPKCRRMAHGFREFQGQRYCCGACPYNSLKKDSRKHGPACEGRLRPEHASVVGEPLPRRLTELPRRRMPPLGQPGPPAVASGPTSAASLARARGYGAPESGSSHAALRHRSAESRRWFVARCISGKGAARPKCGLLPLSSKQERARRAPKECHRRGRSLLQHKRRRKEPACAPSGARTAAKLRRGELPQDSWPVPFWSQPTTGPLSWRGAANVALVEFEVELIGTPEAAGALLPLIFCFDGLGAISSWAPLQFGKLADFNLGAFVLVAPLRPVKHLCFLNDANQDWGFLDGDFDPTLVEVFWYWMEHMARSVGVDRQQVSAWGFSAGAYAVSECLARLPQAVLRNVVLGVVHGHGQPPKTPKPRLEYSVLDNKNIKSKLNSLFLSNLD